MKLGGLVCVRNGIELDYCFVEAIKSLLPVCDVVTVCDGESTDWTQKYIRDWMLTEPKINLCVYKWPDPKGDINFWVDWLNYARVHCPSDFIFQLDADELLSDESYDEVLELKERPGKFTVGMHRYNFWRDSRHVIPPGVCCSHKVVRMGPSDTWLPSDGPHEKGATWIEMAMDSNIKVMHYGFLRKREAWFKKARSLQGMFFDSYDPRLESAERDSGNWMEKIKDVEWIDRLEPFTGNHPPLAHDWLKERGYTW